MGTCACPRITSIPVCVTPSKDEALGLTALPELPLSDFSALLRDAFDLMRELGSAEDRERFCPYMHQPSISEHPQNRDFHDWTALIDLTRDAWKRPRRRNRRSGQRSWPGVLGWHTPYPFVPARLAYFAAAQGSVIPPSPRTRLAVGGCALVALVGGNGTGSHAFAGGPGTAELDGAMLRELGSRSFLAGTTARRVQGRRRAPRALDPVHGTGGLAAAGKDR